MELVVSSPKAACNSLPGSSDREVIRCSYCSLAHFKAVRSSCPRCDTPYSNPANTDTSNETFRHRFGETVHYFRTEKGLSRSDLAARMNVSVHLIVKVENGEHEPTVEDLFPFFRALGCDPYWFMTVLEGGPFLYEISRLLLFVSKSDRNNILMFAEKLASF